MKQRQGQSTTIQTSQPTKPAPNVAHTTRCYFCDKAIKLEHIDEHELNCRVNFLSHFVLQEE